MLFDCWDISLSFGSTLSYSVFSLVIINVVCLLFVCQRLFGSRSPGAPLGSWLLFTALNLCIKQKHCWNAFERVCATRKCFPPSLRCPVRRREALGEHTCVFWPWWIPAQLYCWEQEWMPLLCSLLCCVQLTHPMSFNSSHSYKQKTYK